MGDYASKGVAGSGLGLGIAGTALGLLNSNGGNVLGGLLGGGSNRMSELLAENSMLKSENYSDKVAKEVYAQTVADNNALKDEMYKFIKPISDQVVQNQVDSAVLKAQIEKDKEIAKLQMENCCCQLNSKIEMVASTSACGIAQLNNIVSNITKTIVPISSVCPQPMAQFNSWTAPTTPTTTTGA
jgi:hypothetical protein